MEQLSSHGMDFWEFENCFFYLLRKFKFHEYIAGIMGTLHDDHYPFLIISHSFLLRMKTLYKSVDKIKKHILYSMIFFLKNVPFMRQC